MEAYALRKLLGGTLDLIGNEMLPAATERAVENFAAVLKNAYGKLGNRADQPGTVPPRVLKGILEEAPFAEDALVTEYIGGVLASSRSGIPRDDRGVAYLALVSRLSVYDLRAHYIGYGCLHRLIAGRELDLGESDSRYKVRLFIPMETLREAMDFTEEEDAEEALPGAVVALAKEALIEPSLWALGESQPHVGLVPPHIDEPGWVFVPSLYGLRLFLWAHGRTAFSDFTREGVISPSALTLPSDARLAE
jgi:hypothetical protein